MRDETSLSFHRSDDGYKNLRSDRKSMQSVASTSHLPCAHMHHALPSSGKNGTHHVELAAGMPVDDVDAWRESLSHKLQVFGPSGALLFCSVRCSIRITDRREPDDLLIRFTRQDFFFALVCFQRKELALLYCFCLQQVALFASKSNPSVSYIDICICTTIMHSVSRIHTHTSILKGKKQTYYMIRLHDQK